MKLTCNTTIYPLNTIKKSNGYLNLYIERKTKINYYSLCQLRNNFTKNRNKPH